MTADERTNILAAIDEADLTTAGNSVIAQLFNNLVVTGTVINENKVLVPKVELLAVLSDDEVCNLLDFFEVASNQARAFKYRWDTLSELDMSHVVARSSITTMGTAGIIATEKVTFLLSLGERNKTKADELMGRALTAADIKEARD